MKKTLLLLTLCVVSSLLSAQISGSLDSTFGTNGRVVTRFDTVRNYTESFRTRFAVQKDDKIIVAGIHVASRDFSSSPFRRDSVYGKLMRYNPNGTIDNTFGVNGVVITKTANGINEISKIALQPDGKIIVGGQSDSGRFTLIRYNPNGVIDTTFNKNCAIKIAPNVVGATYLTNIVIQANGKIMVSGTAYIYERSPMAGYDTKLVTIRFDPDGYLDASFNLTGIRYERIDTASIPSSSSYNFSSGVQADNKIILGGTFISTAFNTVLIRYNLNGSLDPTFGRNGRVDINDFFLLQLKVLSNGKILIAGTTPDLDTTLLGLYRLNENGSLDTTFGIRGKVKRQGAGLDVIRFLIQDDEKILVLNSATAFGDSVQKFTRFNSNGTLDGTFGVNGLRTIFFPIASSYYDNIEFQSNRKVIAVGRYADYPTSPDYHYDNVSIITRFNNSVYALNDTCQNATILSPSVPMKGSTANATSETAPNRVLPCETNQNVKDVWYRFRSDTGQLRAFKMQLTFTNLTTTTPFKYVVYSGTCSDFILRGPCKTVTTNVLLDTLTLLEANQDYFIRVWASDSTQIANFSILLQNIQGFNAVPIAQFNTVTACQSFTSFDVNPTNSQKWISMIDPTGIVAEMNPNGNLLGQVTGGYFINGTGTLRRASGTPYLDRNIGIKVVNQPTTDVGIRLYFTERERAAYFAVVAANPIAITHYAGALCSATVQTGSGDLFPALIRSTPSGNYYAEFSTRRFSGFFLGPNRSLVFSKEVNADPAKLMIKEVYPLPISTELAIVFTAFQATTNGRVFITDVLGKVLIDKTINIQSGRNELQINTASLSNGLYFINISDGIYQTAKKVIKQ
jgi:uncharacterized delta-60 repeat protein